MKTVTIALEDEVYASVQREAENRHTSLSDYVREMVLGRRAQKVKPNAQAPQANTSSKVIGSDPVSLLLALQASGQGLAEERAVAYVAEVTADRKNWR